MRVGYTEFHISTLTHKYSFSRKAHLNIFNKKTEIIAQAVSLGQIKNKVKKGRAKQGRGWGGG